MFSLYILNRSFFFPFLLCFISAFPKIWCSFISKGKKEMIYLTIVVLNQASLFLWKFDLHCSKLGMTGDAQVILFIVIFTNDPSNNLFLSLFFQVWKVLQTLCKCNFYNFGSVIIVTAAVFLMRFWKSNKIDRGQFVLSKCRCKRLKFALLLSVNASIFLHGTGRYI